MYHLLHSPLHKNGCRYSALLSNSLLYTGCLCFTLAFPGPKRKATSFHLQNGFLLNWYWSDSVQFSSVQSLSLVRLFATTIWQKKKKTRNQGHCLPLYQLMHHNYFLIKTVSKNVFWWLLLWLSLLLSYQKQILFPDKITHFSTFCHPMEGNWRPSNQR